MNELRKASKNSFTGSPEKLRKNRIIILFCLLLIYSAENFLPVSIKSNPVFIYIGQPILWIIVIVIVNSYQRVKSTAKIRFKSTLVWWTVLLGAAYILIMMLGGVIVGFGRSPYSFSISGIITNFIFVFTALAGRELSRNYLINSYKQRSYMRNLIIIALSMTLINLPLDSAINLKTKLDIVKYIGQDFLPELSNNIMATYLVYLGGPVLSMIYIGMQQCFYWFFPILPNLNWIAKTLVGTLCPFFSFMFIQYIYINQTKVSKGPQDENENPLGWIITSIISVSIIWFTVGVFPVYPSVIVTGSMEPMIYPGDMVLVKRIDLKDLKVGDVIQYKKGNIYIFHRLIKAYEDNGHICYQTKGDNNSIVDSDPVKSTDIKGKVIYVIPKIGWPTLILRGTGDVPKSAVQY